MGRPPKGHSVARHGKPHSKAALAARHAIARRATEYIPEPDPRWQPIARSWFSSLALSGQSAFYEATDWQTAHVAASVLDIAIRECNATMAGLFERMSARLLVTEHDRVRVHLVLAGADPDEQADEQADDTIGPHLVPIRPI